MTYNSGPLVPGNYEVRVESQGFQTQIAQVPVQVGVTSNGNTKLTVGKANEVVEVTSTGTCHQHGTTDRTGRAYNTADREPSD